MDNPRPIENGELGKSLTGENLLRRSGVRHRKLTLCEDESIPYTTRRRTFPPRTSCISRLSSGPEVLAPKILSTKERGSSTPAGGNAFKFPLLGIYPWRTCHRGIMTATNAAKLRPTRHQCQVAHRVNSAPSFTSLMLAAAIERLQSCAEAKRAARECGTGVEGTTRILGPGMGAPLPHRSSRGEGEEGFPVVVTGYARQSVCLAGIRT